VPEFSEALTKFSNVRVDGLLTHFASADDRDQEDFTKAQLEKFQRAVGVFRERGFAPSYIHAANSAATFSFPESRGDLVRPGGALYGFVRDVFPAGDDRPPLRPVMSLHSRIMHLKRVGRGERLGYGGTFETTRESLIATIPIGYDDGYRRALSNRGRVIVRGSFAPVVSSTAG